MKPPIIVDDHGDLSFYSSRAAAERYLEATDVKNEEYQAYDSSGRVLALTTVREGSIDRVKIETTSQVKPNELRNRLASFFNNLSENVDDYENLQKLVERGCRLIDE